MLSPRIRRLKVDYETLVRRFQDWSAIRIAGTAGMPPEIYRFQYWVRGLYVGANGAILERNDHLLEVNLSLGYPRRAPQCRMLTPVFHPNFDESTVCIGDFWAASEGLDDLIIRIGRMISYQEYNTKSPLNGIAARWAAQNSHLLPVDTRPLAPPLQESTAQALPAPSTTQANQNASGGPAATPAVSSATGTATQTVFDGTQAPSIQVTPPSDVPQTAEEEADPWDSKIVIS